jgi:glycosyltransferase involved in cell wall biosynthesis
VAVRILLVNAQGADRFFGGAERYVRDLRDGLIRRGHDVAVLAAFPPRSDDSPVLRTLHDTDWREDRIRRLRNHTDDWIAALPAGVDAILADLDPELVHTNNLPGITTGVWELARRRGIPVAHTLHDYQLLCPRVTLTRRDGEPCDPHPLLCGLRSRRLGRWAAGVGTAIGVSTHVLNRHRGFFGPTTGTRVVLPPLIPVAGAGTAAPAAALRTLGYIGALHAEKGIEQLLAAAPTLAAQGITVRVAGGGPLTDAVAAAPSVEYAGRLEGEAVGAFLAGCDAGVVGSLWEEPGLTFSGLEWLAAGRPVLATANGGLAELAVLGGVHRFDGTEAGLISAAREVGEAQAWAALVATLPPVSGTAELERWLDEHLAAYALAADARKIAA